MTILEPILYANGALRLTDHGPRGGGLVLVHVPTGEQVDIPNDYSGDARPGVLDYLEDDIECFGADNAFALARSYVDHWKQFHHA